MGRLLYRHTLSQEDLAESVAQAHEAATTMQDFYEGIGAGLLGMLVSPQFLYVVDTLQTNKDGTVAAALVARVAVAEVSRRTTI